MTRITATLVALVPRSARILAAGAMLLASLHGQEGSSRSESPKKPADSGAAPERARKKVDLPGLVIDFEKKHVDVDCTVCLDRGLLELVACTKGSKEHESIVTIDARPMHVHTALLLLGANSGSPATRKPSDEDKEHWVDVPPKGDAVDVYLVSEDADGKSVERPLGDFVKPSENRLGETVGAGGAGSEEDETFPSTFVFAGSQLVGDGPGPRKYLCELTGNVISIATFGDELLCLPGIHSNDNGTLMWEVDATHLPKVGTKVKLRLRPRVEAPSQTRKASTDEGVEAKTQKTG